MAQDELVRQTSQYVSPVSPQFPSVRKDNMSKYVDELLQFCDANRKKYDTDWEKYLDLYRGNHWPVRRKTNEWKAFLVVNYIFAIVESIMAVLMDTQPKITCSSISPEQAQYTHGLNSQIDSIWFRRRCATSVSSAMKNALIYGTGFLKVWWNAGLENGLGDVDVDVVPTESLYFDPSATCIDDCEFILEVRKVPHNYLKAHFDPALVRKVKSDGGRGVGTFRQRRYGKGIGRGGWGGLGGSAIQFTTPIAGYSSFGDNPLIADKTDFTSPPYRPTGERDDWCTLIECWIKDKSMEDRPYWDVDTDPITGREVAVQKFREAPKYPHGRLIYTAGGVTLYDEKAPYTRFPYVMFKDIDDPGEFYGIGEPCILEQPQLELNKRRSQIIDHAVLMGNAIWLVEKLSGMRDDEFQNRPGMILRVDGIKSVKREPAVALPSWQIQIIELTIRDMREISGVGTLASGAPPKGARSGSAMENATSIATNRIRLRGRCLEQSLEDMGRIIISHIQRFYTTPRWIRVAGKNGTDGFIPFDGKTVRGDWDIKVESASTQQQSAATRATNAIQLAQAGLIDQESALDAMEWPDKEKVLQRMQNRITIHPPVYPGYPGTPDADSSDKTGYSLATRNMPSSIVPPAPAGAGQQGQPTQGVPQHGGAPEQVNQGVKK